MPGKKRYSQRVWDFLRVDFGHGYVCQRCQYKGLITGISADAEDPIIHFRCRMCGSTWDTVIAGKLEKAKFKKIMLLANTNFS